MIRLVIGRPKFWAYTHTTSCPSLTNLLIVDSNKPLPIKFCQSHLTSTLKDCKVFMRLTSLLKRRVIWARESKESIFDPWSWVSAHLVWSLKREPTQLKLLAKIFGKYLRFSVSTISIHLQTCWTTNSGECIGPTWKLECFWKFSNLVSNN